MQSHLPKENPFVAFKAHFKTEVGIDASQNWALFMEYVKAKSLINVVANLDIISMTVQRIESKIKLVP